MGTPTAKPQSREKLVVSILQVIESITQPNRTWNTYPFQSGEDYIVIGDFGPTAEPLLSECTLTILLAR